MIRSVYFFLALPVLCCMPGFTVKAADGLHLITRSKSGYIIIIPQHPSAMEEKAANELQRLLGECSHALIPVRRDDGKGGGNEILIGACSSLLRSHIYIDFKSLKEDGFTIRTDKNRLVIAGGSGKGPLYGVYTFLEKYIGFRLYTPDAFFIPRRGTVIIPSIKDDTQVPVIGFRSLYYHDDPKSDFYRDWHKLTHHRPTDALPGWGLWVHTANILLPPSEYFEKHPEYYALVDGKRLPTQLCLSNPDVFSIVVENLRKRIAKMPEAKYWSVSQNDNGSYCTCENCKKTDEREGSPSGSVIRFVNSVAAYFPDKIISTLAYQYSRKAPAHIKVAKNVNIMFCSIECNRSLPIAVDTSSASFRKDMEDWSRLTDNIIVWDYVIQFKNLVSPFPNLDVLQPNIQYFVKNHTKAMFEQGNRERGGEMAALRQYLIAKLLWNPDTDIEAATNDFLQGYFGKAWETIGTYIRTLHEDLKRSGQNLDIFAGPADYAKSGFLRKEMTDRYQALFDRAEREAKDDSVSLLRVREARMPLQYALLTIATSRGAEPGGLFEKMNDSMYAPKKEYERMLEDFYGLCRILGYTRLHEWDTTPEEYYSMMRRILANGFKQNLASGKAVSYRTSYDSVSSGGGDKALTDGVFGAYEYRFGWQGFLQSDLDGTIDLGNMVDLHKIEAGFLQIVDDGIFLPKEVDFYVSADGVQFELLDTIPNTVPEKTTFMIRDFGSNKNARTRFVRVVGKSVGMCPIWYSGAGTPCWLFADEIRVW